MMKFLTQLQCRLKWAALLVQAPQETREEGGLFGAASLLLDCLVLCFDFLKRCTHTLQGWFDVMPTRHALGRFCGVAQNVADGQFGNLQIVEHGRQAATKGMHTMPIDARLFCSRNHIIPNQMPEVNGLLRVGGRVEDVSGAAVPRQMRVEILLHYSDYRHGGFAAFGLRVLD